MSQTKTRRSLLLGDLLASPSPHDTPVAGSRHSDSLPDLLLKNQYGAPRRFYSDCIRDQIVVISFMYTRCDGTCPLTSGVLRSLRPQLSSLFGRQLRLISLTLDPLHDTPSELHDYARAYGAPGAKQPLAPWEFLTGTVAQVEQLREALGYKDPDPKLDAIRSNHAAMITFGNDQLNHWSALPVGLAERKLLAGIVRTTSPDPERRYVI